MHSAMRSARVVDRVFEQRGGGFGIRLSRAQHAFDRCGARAARPRAAMRECVSPAFERLGRLQQTDEPRAVRFQQRMQIVPGDGRNQFVVAAVCKHIVKHGERVAAFDLSRGDGDLELHVGRWIARQFDDRARESRARPCPCFPPREQPRRGTSASACARSLS